MPKRRSARSRSISQWWVVAAQAVILALRFLVDLLH